MSIKVKSQMDVYEIDGNECKELSSDRSKLKVLSHWYRPELVILQVDNDVKYTVLAKELEAAIRNAQNTSRF
jgi:hypothetical protein